MRVRLVLMTCQHIQVTTLSGELLEVIDRQTLRDSPRSSETPLVIGMKHLIRNYVASGSSLTPQIVKNLVEAFDF